MVPARPRCAKSMPRSRGGRVQADVGFVLRPARSDWTSASRLGRNTMDGLGPLRRRRPARPALEVLLALLPAPGRRPGSIVRDGPANPRKVREMWMPADRDVGRSGGAHRRPFVGPNYRRGPSAGGIRDRRAIPSPANAGVPLVGDDGGTKSASGLSCPTCIDRPRTHASRARRASVERDLANRGGRADAPNISTFREPWDDLFFILQRHRRRAYGPLRPQRRSRPGLPATGRRASDGGPPPGAA